MSNFTNNNSVVGAQGDNMHNTADINAIGNFALKENPKLERELKRLRTTIEEEFNTAYNKEVLEELEKSKKENNKEKFIKYFTLIKDSVGMISSVVSIANLLNYL